jgi:hypothetical protein
MQCAIQSIVLAGRDRQREGSLALPATEGATMKTILFGLACLLVALVVLSLGPATAQEKRPGKKKDDSAEASIWMKRKLEHSQKILAGLTRGDFQMIEKSAEAMRVVSYLAQWDAADRPEYKRQVRYFDDANKELIRQARNKNLNGATLAYTQLTLSCVQCHTVVRDVKKK